MLSLYIKEWWRGSGTLWRTLSCYLQQLCRLNGGLDTDNWRAYESKEEPNGVRLMLSIDTMYITALERLGWRPFSDVGRATFSLLGVKP
jgi:hypothetical protein